MLLLKNLSFCCAETWQSCICQQQGPQCNQAVSMVSFQMCGLTPQVCKQTGIEGLCTFTMAMVDGEKNKKNSVSEAAVGKLEMVSLTSLPLLHLM